MHIKIDKAILFLTLISLSSFSIESGFCNDNLFHQNLSPKEASFSVADKKIPIDQSYKKLISILEICFKLEEFVFQGLTFTLAEKDKQISKGHTPKVVLYDQLKRKWLFKVIKRYKKGIQADAETLQKSVDNINNFFNSEDFTDSEKLKFAKIELFKDHDEFRKLDNKSKNKYIKWLEQVCVYSNFTAVPAYRIYTAFGLDTPEIHYKVLIINGNVTLGTMQRFIDHDDTLDPDVNIAEFTTDSLNYLMKVHILNYFLGNVDPNLDSLLIKRSNQKIVQLIDSDISILYPFISDADPNIFEYFEKRKFFGTIWENHINNRISLPLLENYAFLKFIELFPENYFTELLYFLKKEPAKKSMISKKRLLVKTFNAFYERLLNQNEDSTKSITDNDIINVINGICLKIKRRITAIEDDHVTIHNIPKVAQQEFNMFFLDEAYWLVWKLRQQNDFKDVYGEELYKGESRFVLNRLYRLLETSNNHYEKKAIKKYIENVEEYREYFNQRDVPIKDFLY